MANFLKSGLTVGQSVHGFVVKQVTPLPELRLVAVEALHAHSGARFLHLHCPEDAENLFTVAFSTPPADDTGVPHILEHSVLCGSRKYPVKDPFLEMLKMSMATFINAMTYPDRTLYPVASNVKQDYFNLAEVYVDAVFHPRITPLTLKQEGHHLDFAEPGNPQSPLIIKGIVYNEMKGAYSDLDSLIARSSTQLLFPDSIYGYDSGGAPERIADLTYEQFRSFYELHYAPSNAYILSYGDIPTLEHLAFLDQHLSECPAGVSQASSIQRQPRWATPREHVESYPVAKDDELSRKTAVTMNWLVGVVDDPLQDLAMDIVDRLLLGSAGAPLRKALVDSKLGEDLADSGYSSGNLETTFHVGLKGTEVSRKDEIVDLVLKVLRECVQTGFSREQVDTAFQQLQYAHREIQSMYPMRLMSWVYNAWVYGLDPLMFLRTGARLDDLYRQYLQNPDYFAKAIEESLLRNPHRLTVVFVPEPGLQEKRDQEFAAKIARSRQELTPEETQRILTEAEELQRSQSQANTAEEIASLPQLTLADLPHRPRIVPRVVEELNEKRTFIHNEVFANGVNYLALALDLTGLPAELWNYLPLFTYVFTRMGTAGENYVRLSERIAAHTGGISASTFAASDAADPGRLVTCLAVHAKGLDRNYAETLSIVQDVLGGVDFSDSARLRDLLLQIRVRQQSGIVPNGHQFAATHAGRSLSTLGSLEYLWSGMNQVRLVEAWCRNLDEQIPEISRRLTEIREFLFHRSRVWGSFTGTASMRDQTRLWLGNLDGGASPLSGDLPPPPSLPVEFGRLEGLAVPSEVAFCAACLPAPHVSHPDSSALSVFSKLLALDYFWEKIRVQGGAYGGMSAYNAVAGVVQFMSYRDPNVAETLEVFSRTLEYVQKRVWTPREIERGIITCAKSDEQPIRPSAATSKVLWRYLTGYTDELRIERREKLLQVDASAVKRAALDLLHRYRDEANVCVVAAQEKLALANQNLAKPLSVENVFQG
jgi:Zn-dependent M16 (insulinase) family peptidase